MNIKKIKEEVKNGISIVIAGIIETSRQVITKITKNAFLKISDLTDSIEAVAFPRIFTESINILVPEKCIASPAKFLFVMAKKASLLKE